MRVLLLLFLAIEVAIHEAKWVIYPVSFTSGGGYIYMLHVAWGDEKGEWRRITVSDWIDIAEIQGQPQGTKPVKQSNPNRTSKTFSSGLQAKPHVPLYLKPKEHPKQRQKVQNKVHDHEWKYKWSYRGIVLDENDEYILQLKDNRVTQGGPYKYVYPKVLEAALNAGIVQLRLQDTITKKAGEWTVKNPEAPKAPSCWINNMMRGFPLSPGAFPHMTEEGLHLKTPLIAGGPLQLANKPQIKINPKTGASENRQPNSKAYPGAVTVEVDDLSEVSAYNEYYNEYQYGDYEYEFYDRLLNEMEMLKRNEYLQGYYDAFRDVKNKQNRNGDRLYHGIY